MGGIAVRTFRGGDARQVSKVMVAAFRSFLGEKYPRSTDWHFSPAQLARASLHRDKHSETASFVAIEGGRVVGYVKVTAQDSGLGSLEIVGVSPDCAGKGIGDLLMRRAEKFWRRKRQRKIHTCVASHNRKAMIYYIRNGFVPEGYMPDHFIPGVHEIPLGRFL